MVDAADDRFEQLMEFEPGQEMGSAATSWEDTFGPAREPQLMPDERNAISPWPTAVRTVRGDGRVRTREQRERALAREAALCVKRS